MMVEFIQYCITDNLRNLLLGMQLCSGMINNNDNNNVFIFSGLPIK